MTDKKRKINRITCPYCGSEHIATYLYGMMVPDDEIMQQASEGKVIPVGCIIPDNAPKYHCNDCGKDFGSELMFEKLYGIKNKS